MVKLTYMSNRSNERGAVAMLTVIFLALLLTIVTVSFVRLSITEQRQATDDDLTSRAFYAAESGVEDAKRAIKEYYDQLASGTVIDLKGDECEPYYDGLNGDDPADDIVLLSPFNDLDAAYTCQLIDLNPPTFESDLQPWEGVTVPLKTNGVAYDKIEISWHQKGLSPPYNGRYLLRNSSNLPVTSVWRSGDGFPAMLRMNLFSINGNGTTFDRTQFRSTTTYFNPASLGSTTLSTPTTQDGQIFNVRCQTLAGISDGDYACRLTIDGLIGDFDPSSPTNPRTNYLRLNALYRATNVKVRLLDSTNREVGFEGVQAIVDVTGRAGSVFRRVQARLSLIEDYNLPDAAILTADDICKNFAITDDPAEFIAVNTGVVVGSCVGP